MGLRLIGKRTIRTLYKFYKNEGLNGIILIQSIIQKCLLNHLSSFLFMENLRHYSSYSVIQFFIKIVKVLMNNLHIKKDTAL